MPHSIEQTADEMYLKHVCEFNIPHIISLNTAYCETLLGFGGHPAVQHALSATSFPVHCWHFTPPDERPEKEIYVTSQQNVTWELPFLINVIQAQTVRIPIEQNKTKKKKSGFWPCCYFVIPKENAWIYLQEYYIRLINVYIQPDSVT